MTRMPTSALPAITFPIGGTALPTTVPLVPTSSMPTSFASTVVSSLSVPMLLPSTRLPVPARSRLSPIWELALITFPAPGTDPPIVLSCAPPATLTPSPLPRPTSPVLSVPM